MFVLKPWKAILEGVVEMNESLQQAISKLIEKALESADAAGSFLSAEIPEVIEQLLLWNAISSGLLFSLSILIIISCLFTGKFSIKCLTTDTPSLGELRDNPEKHPLFTIKNPTSSWASVTSTDSAQVKVTMSVIWSILGLALAACCFSIEWLQILIAPKVWLIEYASNLVH